MKKLTILIAIFSIGLASYFFWPELGKVQAPAIEEQTASVAVEDYVRQYISKLSPEKEVLGGKFYVTSIEAHGGAGTVSYEDGHNDYTADFTYNVDEQGRPSIKSFVIRK